jgi:hypothetical protein
MVLVELARIVNETPKPMEIIAHDSHSNSQAGKRRIYFTKKKKKHILVHTEPKRNSIQSSSTSIPTVLLGRVDVEKAVGVRIFVRRAQAVASVLEPGQALPPGRYRPHYRSSLGLVDGSEVSSPD